MTRLRHAASILVLLMLVLLSCGTTAAQAIPNEQPAPGDAGALPEPVTSRHLYDYADLLNDAQEASIASDADRLQRFGVPSVILVLASDMTQEEAVPFASELLAEWSVESAPGTADGVVMLVVVDPTGDGNVFTVMAWGNNALPHFGIDRDVASRVHHQWLDAYVQEGYVFEGILYSLRQLVYHSIYDPASEAGLEGFRSVIHTLASWLSPLLAMACIVLAIAKWTGRIERLHYRRREMDLVMVWGMPVLACIVAAIAVWAESGMAVATALILGAIPVAEWVRRDPANRHMRLWDRVAP